MSTAASRPPGSPGRSATAPKSRILTAGWVLLAAACALGVAGFYRWTLASTRGDLQVGRDKQDYYNLLVDGFEEGHLYMKAEVAPELLALPREQRPGNAPHLLDASVYGTHYYLYFGVAPAVLLHWPFSALTGLDLPDALAVLVLALGALLFAFLWWLEMRRQFLPGLGAKLDWLAILCLGLGTAIPAVLRRPLFYEEAALGGWLFAAMMLWALARAWRSERRAASWLVVAGLACGLAAGSRANLVLVGVGALGVGAWLAAPRFGAGFRRGILPALLWAGAGAGLVGAGLAAYNYARFGSILEFGHSYQMGQNPRQMFRVSNLAHNAGLYYGRPPVLNAYFPYVMPPEEGPRPEDYIGRESVHGEWLWTLLALAVAPAAWQARRSSRLRFALPVGLWFAGNFLVTGMTGIRANRYMLDFHTALVAVTLLGVGWVLTTGGWRGRLWSAGLLLLALLAVLFNILASCQVHGFFRERDPVGYQRLGGQLDQVPWLVAPGIFREAGGVETTVRWPPRGEGGVVPLLTIGGSEFQDRLWVRLNGQGHAAFEWQHGEYGTALGPLFAYQPGTEARLRLAGASLIPPVWHGWYGTHPETERAALKRRLRIWVEDAMVFDRDVPSHSSASWLNRWNEDLRAGPAKGRRPDTGWASALAQRRGAVRLEFGLPGNRFGMSEPLVQTGVAGAWDVIMVRYTRPGYVQVVHDSVGQGGVSSEEFPADYRQTQQVEVELPAARESLAWNERDTLQKAEVRPVVVRWNGRVVLTSPIVPHPAEAGSLAIGMNDYATGCRRSFAGELRVAPFLEALAEPGAAAWSRRLVPVESLRGVRGVLMHWRQDDGRQAALVWRRPAPESPPQLGWLDNGYVEWAGALAGAAVGDLRVEQGASGAGEMVPFSVAWAGRELLAGTTDFFTHAPVAAHALAGEPWTSESRRSLPSTLRAAGRPGRIKMYLALPRGGLVGSAPLLTTGRAGHGDSIFLRPVSADTYVVGVDHWGVAAQVSGPLKITPERKFAVTVEMGSLFEPGEFPADRVRVSVDEATVLDVRVPLYPVTAGEVEFGRNTPGFSTSGERFPGELFSVRRHVP